MREQTLTDFLLARIAEDEAQNTEARRRIDEGYWSPNEARRWAAECEAKRRLIRWLDDFTLREQGLSLLALPYADHPDYREEWKP